MEKFGQREDKYFALLDPKRCLYHPPGERFELAEKDANGSGDGAARVWVSSGFPCFQIPDTDQQARFSLLSEDLPQVKRCADHTVFLFDPSLRRWSSHIFEFIGYLDISDASGPVIQKDPGMYYLRT